MSASTLQLKKEVLRVSSREGRKMTANTATDSSTGHWGFLDDDEGEQDGKQARPRTLAEEGSRPASAENTASQAAAAAAMLRMATARQTRKAEPDAVTDFEHSDEKTERDEEAVRLLEGGM